MSVKEPFTDLIFIPTGSTANTSCNAYCATNANNEVTLNNPSAHSARCISTSLIVQPCMATNATTTNCFCVSSLNGMFTTFDPSAPIPNVADITACQQLCANNSTWCHGTRYNDDTKACSFQTQLAPVTI